MKAVHLLLAVGVALFLLGCSSITITSDYDREANFAAMKTFDWATVQKNAVSADAQTVMFQNSLIEKHMKNAVTKQLATKGITPSTDKPNFLVGFYMQTAQKTQVTDYGYGYGYGARWGGGGVDVHQYTQGTLILDFVDAASNQLVWRAVASGALSDNPDPTKAEQKINDIVEQMLKDYPPAAKK